MSIESAIETDVSARTQAVRPCPFCSATMFEEVSLCGLCGRFSKPIIVAKPIQTKKPLIERANTAIAKWESDPQTQQWLNWLYKPLPNNIPQAFQLGAGLGLLILSAAMGLLWLLYQGWWLASGTIALFAIGGALILGKQLLRAGVKPVVEQNEVLSNEVSIRILGYDLNLAVIQTIAIGGIVVFALRYEIDTARSFAFLSCLLVPLLWATRLQRLAILLGSLSFLYLMYLWTAYDARDITMARIYARSVFQMFTPFVSFFWTLMVIAAIPQLQVPQVGGLGIGRLKGDFSIKLFGSHVPIAVMSALILVSVIPALEATWYAPSWLRTLWNEIM